MKKLICTRGEYMKHKVGNIYNNIEFLSRKKGFRKGLFKCHCGKEFECKIDSITSGHSKSCGCGLTYNRKEPGMSNFKASASKIIAHIKRRKIDLELSLDDIISIMKQSCVYCGDEGGNISNSISCQVKTINFNGLDRIDSSKGYLKDNVVPCCKKCNFAKSDMSKEDFISHINKIYYFNKK